MLSTYSIATFKHHSTHINHVIERCESMTVKELIRILEAINDKESVVHVGLENGGSLDIDHVSDNKHGFVQIEPNFVQY